MENEFDMYLTKIFKDMENERSKLSHPFVGSEHLILSLLKNDKMVIHFFHDFGVTYDNFLEKLTQIVGTCKKNVDFNLYTPLLKRVINYAIEESKLNKEKVSSKYIIESLLEENEGVAIRILTQMDVDLDEMYASLSKKKMESNVNINFGKNLNKTICMEEKVIGREKEINFMIETLLRKKKNNPLLIGDAGVGKSAIVEQLARMINESNVPNKLKSSNIISLDMSSIVGGTKYRGEFEEKLNKIIESAEKDSNIILFIDEIHTISNAGGADGAIGAGDIFKPYLARGNIKVIGATTTEEYEKYILKDKALARRFETVLIKEPSLKETTCILNKIKHEYEKFHNVIISKKNIMDIISLADQFIVNKKNPDKSIDFLDSVSSYVQIKNDNTNIVNKYLDQLKDIKLKKEKYVCENNYDLALVYHDKELEIEKKLKSGSNLANKISLKDIYKVLETKTNVPCLLNKKNLVEKFSSLLVDKDADLIKFFNDKISDLGCLKTLFIQGDGDNVVKIFRDALENITYIKINGEDFEKEESIIKLVGNYQGYTNNENYILKKLKTNPYAIIYVKNYDLLASNIKNLFKEIVKEEVLKDDKMDEVSFKNTIIIASSMKKEKKKVGFSNDSLIENTYDIPFNCIINVENDNKMAV